MNKIKIEVHPSVLLGIFAMLAVIFFYSSKESPDFVEVRVKQKIENPLEKTWDYVYANYPYFPEAEKVDTNAGSVFFLDDELWIFDPVMKEFLPYNLDLLTKWE